MEIILTQQKKTVSKLKTGLKQKNKRVANKTTKQSNNLDEFKIFNFLVDKLYCINITVYDDQTRLFLYDFHNNILQKASPVSSQQPHIQYIDFITKYSFQTKNK